VTREWWKSKKSFSNTPGCSSAIELKELSKFWAKNDEMKLYDTQGDHSKAPVDPFKTVYSKI
jgi:hypothetical protein